MTPSPEETTRSAKSGLGPGSLVHIGDKRESPVKIRVIDYDNQKVDEIDVSELEQCSALRDSPSVSWVDIDGIHDAHIVEEIGKKFDIHVLVLEDIMNSTSRPKVEFFDSYMFITLKMLELEKDSRLLNVEQLSLIVGEKYLVMFQEHPGDSFNPIRDRIRQSKGKVRSKDAYYLAYLVLDTVVDNYITVSEQFADQIEALEAIVIKRPNEFTLQRILNLRKELLDFKRSIDPLKEAINTMTRELDEEMAKYYRDLHDHIIYESENLAMYREMIVNLLDLYHSNLGMRMNQVMKVLTIITTIFVPLTFIVGVYGMNFDNMPELRTKNGYFVVMGGMFILVLGMLFYFRKKKWL
jgi:magnesium transporter